MFNEKRILITGGTGTVGQELTKGLLTSWAPDQVVIFSRNEVSQVMMCNRFENDPRLSFIIGDIRDKKAIKKACRGIDIVFHLAALKHVGICEKQPDEAVKTNILGADNLICAAKENEVEKVINMSTDKAVNPCSFYGNTKATAEKLFASANGDGNTEFINIRSGNVFGSSGSVVLLLKESIINQNRVVVTSYQMTRYFISIREIADFLLKVCRLGQGGNTYIPSDMKAFRLGDLVNILIEKYGNSSTAIREIGIQPGEKMDEELFAMNERVCILDGCGKIFCATIHTTSANHVKDMADLKKWIYENNLI